MNKKKYASLIDPKFSEGIAHRGLHNEKFTENGLKAFQNAIDHDVAFEFDIHLTKDKELLVCHDADLVRTTGKAGKIEELSLKEIRDNYKLLDGGVVPTLQEVIDLNHDQVPMVIELKVVEKNYKELCKAFRPYLTQFKDKKRVMIISFDPRSLWPLKKEGFPRSFLHTSEYRPAWLFRGTIESIDMELAYLKEKPKLRYAKRHYTNVWTIENLKDLDDVKDVIDTITFQHIDVDEVRKYLKNK